MSNLLEDIRMQMYQNRKKKDIRLNAVKRQQMKRNNVKAIESTSNIRVQEIGTNNTVPTLEEKETKALENQGNIFENIIEKVIPNEKKISDEIKESQIVATDDALLNQIDEFRMKAQQLQQLLDSKQEKAIELQKIVEEREDKAEELDKIVKERQERADGFTEAVEKKIDDMVGSVDSRLAEMTETVGNRIEESEKQDSVRADELKAAMDAVKAELSEKIHTESVQSYRNVSDLLKKVETRLNTLSKLEKNVVKLRKLTYAIIVFTIINLIGVVVSILLNLGIIVF